MQRLEVATDVFVEPGTAYEFLVSFGDYSQYSEYLESVTRYGDGTAGTEYDLTFAWWRLSYTARSRVTGVDPPRRVDWRLVSDLTAQGQWLVEPLGSGESRDGPPSASRVRFVVTYDPESADAASLGLPRLVSLDAVVDRVLPLVREEATRVVERVVADLEGEPREVDLDVELRGE